MTNADLTQLRETGAVLLRGGVPKDVLMPLAEAAGACFAAVGEGYAGRTGFTPFSYSVLLEALLGFGVNARGDLLAPVVATSLAEFAAEAMGEPMLCKLEQSWVRKRFAPVNAPHHYHPNSWHQDGGLGVSYAAEPGSAMPMTRVLTLWLPLHACGKDSPGLEFVRRRMECLIHYTELQDDGLRQRFAPEHFWAPELQTGDALLFLADSLHRTYVRPDMRLDRLSLEYRFFPVSKPLAHATTMEA